MMLMTPKLLRLCVGLLLLSLSVASTAEVKLVLEPPKGLEAEEIHERLQSSPTLEGALSFLNGMIATKEDIHLHFGNYHRIWYQSDKIEIPYDFIYSIRQGYKHSRIPHRLNTVDEFTGNTLFHVIFHEMAHALIDQYDIPVIGREEDAADNFADVLLLHFFEKGDDIVVSAADLFYLDTIHNKGFSDKDYWADHSLPPQRYFYRLCNVYGSNPAKHWSLKRRAGFDEERAERCIFQYEEIERSWLRQLEPAIKSVL